MLPPSLLEQFVVGEVFAFLVIFSRLGAALMLMPGIGETYIAARSRLGLALMFSLVLTPVFEHLIPDPPGDVLTVALLLAAEITIGLFFGFICRLLVSTLHVAGTIIAYQSSLAMAAIFDATQTAQSTVIGNFLTISAIVLFFTLDIHHLMINGIADSYTLFAPGHFPPLGDMSEYISRTLGSVFIIAFRLAAAHIVFSLIFYIGSGVLARLMPTLQVFFVMMPAQVIIGFFLLMAMLQSIMFIYAGFVENALVEFMDW